MTNDDGSETTRKRPELRRWQPLAGGAVTETDAPVTDAMTLKHLREMATRDAGDLATPCYCVRLLIFGSQALQQHSTCKVD